MKTIRVWSFFPGFFQIPNDPSEMVIDLTDHAIVGRAHAAHLGLGHGAGKPLTISEELRLFDRPPGNAPAADAVALRPPARRPAPVPGKVPGIVERIIWRRGDKRRVRPIVAEMQKPWPMYHALKVRQGALGRPGEICQSSLGMREAEVVTPGPRLSSGNQISSGVSGTGKPLVRSQLKYDTFSGSQEPTGCQPRMRLPRMRKRGSRGEVTR